MAALLATAEATAATTATTAARVVGVVPATTFCGHVGRGLVPTTMELHALLESSQLRVEIAHRYGLDTRRHRRHHQIEFKIQSGQYVGDQLFIF